MRSPRGEKTSVGDLGLGELGSLIIVIARSGPATRWGPDRCLNHLLAPCRIVGFDQVVPPRGDFLRISAKHRADDSQLKFPSSGCFR